MCFSVARALGGQEGAKAQDDLRAVRAFPSVGLQVGAPVGGGALLLGGWAGLWCAVKEGLAAELVARKTWRDERKGSVLPEQPQGG